MNSSLIPSVDLEYQGPAFHAPRVPHCQSKRIQAEKALPPKTAFRQRSVGISLLLALTFLLLADELSVSFAQNAPASDTKGSLVLFDFGDANDKQIRDAAIARFNK